MESTQATQLLLRIVLGTEEEKGKIAQCAQNILYYMKVLEHASTCTKPTCDPNCKRIKLTMRHAQDCKLAGCKPCINLLRLSQLHARQCTKGDNCPVTDCVHLRVLQE